MNEKQLTDALRAILDLTALSDEPTMSEMKDALLAIEETCRDVLKE